MGLEALLATIEEACQHEEQRIRDARDAAIAAIEKAAEDEVQHISRRAFKNLEPYLEKEKARRMNAAHRFALEEAGKIKARLAFDVREAARLHLDSLREQNTYASVLKVLGDEAIAMVDADKIIVEIDARDQNIAAMLWPHLELKATLETAAGARAHSRDGLIVCDNTVEARLSRILSEYKVTAEFLH